MIEGIKIVGLSVLAAVLYGIIHDNVTARVCVEYFTVFHPIIVPTTSPTVLALVWGVIATWWMGLGLGIALALFARWGKRPKLHARQLVRPMALLLAVMGQCSLLMGLVGYSLASWEWISAYEPWASRIEAHKHPAFLGDLWAHNAAYTIGFVGGISLGVWSIRTRQRLEKDQLSL